MSIDRELSLRRGPAEIRNRQFVWVRKGYDPDQVQDFLGQIADMVEGLQTDLSRLKSDADKASWQKTAAREEAYQELANRMADLLKTAEAHAETIRREAEQEINQVQAEARAQAEETRTEAKEEKEKILREASTEAERVRREAAAEAERIRRENNEAMKKARAEAEHIVGVLASRRDILLAEVNTTRERLLGILDKVNAAVPPSPAAAAPAPVPVEVGAALNRGNAQQRPERPVPGPRRIPEASPSEPLELVLPDIPALEDDLEK